MTPPFGRCSDMYLCTHRTRKGKTFLFTSSICISQKGLPLHRPNFCICQSPQFIPYPNLYIPRRGLSPHKLNIWIFHKCLFLHSLSIYLSQGKLLLDRSAQGNSGYGEGNLLTVSSVSLIDAIAASCFASLVDDLRLLLREAKERNRQPSPAAILDSRTLQ